MFTRVFFFLTMFLCAWFLTPCQAEDLNTMSADELKSYIEENKPTEDAFVAVQRLALPQMQQREWSEAAAIFQEYAPQFPDMQWRFQAIIDSLQAPEKKVKVRNLGPTVNTEHEDYMPVLSLDGKMLYFGSSGRSDGVGGEDIYTSKRKEDGTWGQSQLIDGSINTERPEAALAIAPDQTTLYLFGNFPESLGHGDIFYVEKSDSGWSAIRHLPAPLNTEYFDADTYPSADGNALLLVSDRPGGVGEYHQKDEYFHGYKGGNLDIYVSIKTDSGWGEPVNLGNVVNTPYCERSPFLTADGKTLIFSSDGHYGFGMLDLFKCERLSDTSWTEWSQPVNLGKTYNSGLDDWGYQLSADGKTAYYTSYMKDAKSDIFSVDFGITVSATIVSGAVQDSSGAALAAKITWEDLETGEIIGELRSDPQTGRYTISLPNGKMYGYYASVPKSDYYPLSQRVDLRDSTGFNKMNVDIIMGSFIAHNIFFDYDSYELRPESAPELKRLADYLQQRPERNVEIQGYTCDKGSDAYNVILSRRRAESVVKELRDLGIPAKRLRARGYGKTNPLYPNSSEENRVKNRRVEFQFIS